MTGSQRVFVRSKLLMLVLAGTAWLFGSVPTLSAQETEGVVPPNLGEDDSSVVQIGSKYPEFDNAVKLFLRGDFDGAEALLKKLKEKNPELAPPGVLMGKLFLNAKNPARARNEFEKAVRDDPTDPEAYVVFGNTALQQREFTDATLLYEKAAEVAEQYTKNPERKKYHTLRALLGIAAVAEAREQWDLGEESLRKALKVDPENYPALLQLGRILFNKKKEQDAYTVFQEAYRIDKEKVARPEVNMARMYQNAKDDAHAKQLMDRAKERDPNSLLTRLAIAQWALETDRLEEAEENSKAALKIDPNNFDVQVLQGILARIRKDYPAAEAAFLEANRISPSNGLVLNQIAIALAEQDDPKKRQTAAEYAQMANKLYGDRSTVLGRDSLVVLAWVLYRLERLPEAVQVVGQALGSGGVNNDVSYFAAKILHESGRNDVALQLLNAALDDNTRLFPNRKDAQDLRGKVLAASGTNK